MLGNVCNVRPFHSQHLYDFTFLLIFGFAVTGTRPDEEVKRIFYWIPCSSFSFYRYSKPFALQTIDNLIETGNSEQIFQKAIQEQGRGQVCSSFIPWTLGVYVYDFVLSLIFSMNQWVSLNFYQCRLHNFTHCLMQVMDTLAEIQERHNTVKDLEKKLLELQQVNDKFQTFSRDWCL